MTETRGKFITIEGVEGVGKSTQIGRVEDFLRGRGIDFICSREPGGTAMAEQIRELLLAPQEETVHGLTELLLIFAARTQHLREKIQPALREGTWVLCDRFTDATYAYQGAGRGLGEHPIALLEELVQEQLRPDLTVVLDLDPETGLRRAEQRGDLDRFEQEHIEFFQRVRQAYRDMAAAAPQRYLLVDASAAKEEVSGSLLAGLAARLGLEPAA